MANDWNWAMHTMMPRFRGEQTRVTSSFARHLSRSRSPGVDLSYPSPQAGGPIFSPIEGRAGVVAGSAWNTVYVYDKDGNQHGFLHMSAVTVRDGQRVQAGTQLGFEGGMGPTKGGGKSNTAYTAHLHYQIKVNGRNVDPVVWWNRGVDPGQEASPREEKTPEQVVEEDMAASGGDTPAPANPPPPKPPVGNSSEYAPRQASKSQVSGSGLAVWSNRVPSHEPWPRVLLSDETTNQPTDRVNYNVNHEPQIADDGTEDTSGKIGKLEGEDTIARNKFWRR